MADFIIGLDLGQAKDSTIVSVFKRSLCITQQGMPARKPDGRYKFSYACLHIDHVPLGIGYPAIVERICALHRRPELGTIPRLAIDATGLGAPVVDMFIESDLRGEIYPITTTSGQTANKQFWRTTDRVVAYTVPKTELVTNTIALFSTRRLAVARMGRLSEEYKTQLISYELKYTKAGNVQYEAAGGEHDDYVTSGMNALWLGENREIDYDFTDVGPEQTAVMQEKTAIALEEKAEEEEREREWRDPWIDFDTWKARWCR